MTRVQRKPHDNGRSPAGGKFKVRSGTSSIETVIFTDRVLVVRFDPRLAHLLGNPDRAPEPEVEAPETDGE